MSNLKTGVNFVRYLVAIAIFLTSSQIVADGRGNEGTFNEREITVCGALKERLLFWIWSSVTLEPDIKRVSGNKFIKPIEYVTSDRKTLSGYKYLSNDGAGSLVPAKGYVLMAMGNAQIADHAIGQLHMFANQNYDVYIYDYRGYGNSEGKRRINAIIEDYKEITQSLNKDYDRKLLYGISLGGAVILNVIGSGIEYDSAVIDSSPSLLSTHGCPKRIDPLENLPSDASKLLVITGQKDDVLNESMTSELRIAAKSNGAKTVNAEFFSHPFMDDSFEIHMRRLKMVKDHLFDNTAGNNNE